MKQIALISSLLLGVLLQTSAVEKEQFERMRKMEGTFSAGQHGRLLLTGDVYGQSRNFPDDLRIIASDGTQWPFFLYQPVPGIESLMLAPKILNRSWVEGPEPCLQFDLIIPPVKGKVPVHNRMELKTTGRDYVRRVEIFTGNGNGRLASGYLIDFSRQRNAQNRVIRYPDSDAERLHVRIYPNAQAGGETFTLSNAMLRYRAVVDVERETVDFSQIEGPESEKVKEASNRILDLGEPGRPVEFITFDVENKSFARCVSIYGRNEEHEPWKWVGGGEIHALEGSEENTVKLHAQNRYLKVKLFHYDDPPLDISSIVLEAIPRYLVFEAASGGTAALYFRAWDMKAPRYDLEGRIDHEEVPDLPVIHTGAAQPNEAAKEQPLRKYSKLLSGLAVAAVSLLVLWVIASMLKQQKAGME